MSWWTKVKSTVLAVAAVMNITSDQICFDKHGIGCFSNKAPFNNARGLLPQSPDDIKVQFLLYTRLNKFNYQKITKNIASIKKSGFNGGKKTKFIIHGYRDDGRETWVKNIRNAILTREDVNVIVVDWETGADKSDYNQAVANCRVVGALVAQLMKALSKTSGALYNEMHLIGHSLGAHIAGYAGARVPGTGRITGLDPAGPGFSKRNIVVRLDSTDAKFVDVIHTDGEPIIKFGFGLSGRIGDADFYPNYGKNQPGCKAAGLHVFTLITGKFKSFTRGVACSHSRARDLYIESIRSTCSFKSYPCISAIKFKRGKCPCNGKCARMGYDADKDKPRGSFYLLTNSKAPFCIA